MTPPSFIFTALVCISVKRHYEYMCIAEGLVSIDDSCLVIFLLCVLTRITFSTWFKIYSSWAFCALAFKVEFQSETEWVFSFISIVFKAKQHWQLICTTLACEGKDVWDEVTSSICAEVCETGRSLEPSLCWDWLIWSFSFHRAHI